MPQSSWEHSLVPLAVTDREGWTDAFVCVGGGRRGWRGLVVARSYIKSSQCCMGVFTGFPLLWRVGVGGGCLKKTSNQAENEAAVCALLYSGYKMDTRGRGEKKRKTKEASAERSNRYGFRANWSQNHNLHKKPLALSSNRKSDLFIYMCSIFPAIRRPRVLPDPSSLTFGLYIRENLCRASEQNTLSFCWTALS